MLADGLISTRESIERNMDERFAKVDLRFDVIETVLRIHTADIHELKGDVRELKGDVRELKGDVRELKTTSEN